MTESEPATRRLGYARVSAYGQTLDAQLEQLRADGCAKMFRENVTGARADRRELLKLLRAITPGDLVTVTRIDRLARSTFDLFVIVKRIVGAGGQFRSLAEPWADTATITGQLMIAVLGGLADVERDLIRTRTAEGRSRAKARGQHMGRPPKLTPQQQKEARRRRAVGATLKELADSHDAGLATISRTVLLNRSSREKPVYRHELTRVYELREIIQDPLALNAYFRDFDDRLREYPVMLKHFRDIEKELQGLDTSAWNHLKGKAAPFLIKKSETRGWYQLFDTLNEAKGYNHLLQMGYTNVEFIPASSTRGKRTPDLKGVMSTTHVLCEVKTINISEVEADRRHSGAAGSTHLQLPDGFFRKLKSDMEAAKNQLVKFDADESVRRVVYIIVNFDDSFHQYVHDYTGQIELFVSRNPMPEIEIAFHIKPPYYSATV